MTLRALCISDHLAVACPFPQSLGPHWPEQSPDVDVFPLVELLAWLLVSGKSHGDTVGIARSAQQWSPRE